MSFLYNDTDLTRKFTIIKKNLYTYNYSIYLYKEYAVFLQKYMVLIISFFINKCPLWVYSVEKLPNISGLVR